MTPERRQFLDRNVEERLTHKELADGYIFCVCEFDGLLIHKSEREAEFCDCLRARAALKGE